MLGEAIFEPNENEFLSPPYDEVLFKENFIYFSFVLISNDANFFLDCIDTFILLLLNILSFGFKLLQLFLLSE